MLMYKVFHHDLQALVKKGYIVRTGEKRMGKLGSKQSVLKVKEE
jgi:hypothetical protein